MVVEVFDAARRPAQLTYAETPADFVTMYGSGPISRYANYPHSKGAYLTKEGSVIARAILFEDMISAIWRYGRIYSINPEVTRQFRAALESNGITELQT